MSHRGKFTSFVVLSRPVFLAGGVLAYALGAAIGRAEGFDRRAFWIGQAMVTAVQLSTQYANEYFDVETDALVGDRRTWFTGGSGILSQGALMPSTARAAALAASVVGLIMIAIVSSSSESAALVGLLALVGGWAYSTPPLRLVSTPYGITAASIIVAFLTPLAGALLQGSGPGAHLLAATIPLVLLHHAMLLGFERPDRDADEGTGKRTATVRLGPGRAALLHHVLVLGAFAGFGIGVASDLTTAWALAALPVGVLLVAGFERIDDLWLTLAEVAMFATTTLALLVGSI